MNKNTGTSNDIKKYKEAGFIPWRFGYRMVKRDITKYIKYGFGDMRYRILDDQIKRIIAQQFD